MRLEYEFGRWIRETCRNGVGGSSTVSTLWSRLTPMISNDGPSEFRVRIVLPIALSFGQ